MNLVHILPTLSIKFTKLHSLLSSCGHACESCGCSCNWEFQDKWETHVQHRRHRPGVYKNELQSYKAVVLQISTAMKVGSALIVLLLSLQVTNYIRGSFWFIKGERAKRASLQYGGRSPGRDGSDDGMCDATPPREDGSIGPKLWGCNQDMEECIFTKSAWLAKKQKKPLLVN